MKKIFKQKQKNNEEENIFKLPIQSISDEGYLICENNIYRMICKVSPINARLATNERLCEISDSIQGAISSYEGRKGIYIVSERVDIKTNLLNIDKRSAELNDEFSTDMLQVQKEHLESMAKNIKNILNFYFVVETQNKDEEGAKQALEDIYVSVSSELGNGGMSTIKLEKDEIKSLLYSKMNPEQSIKEPYRDDFELENIYPQNAVRCKDGRHLEIENMIYRYFAITKYPKTVDKYRWLNKLLDINGNVNIAIILNPKNPTKINKELADAIRELDGKKQRAINAGNENEKLDYERQINSAKEMLKKLGDDNVGLYDTALIISAGAEDMRKLEQLSNIITTKISSSYLQSVEIKRKDFEPFFATLPILADNKVTRNYIWNLTSDDIASIIPFDSSEYMEQKGIFVAQNEISKGLVIVDYRNKIYNNSHMCVLADSGSGKTFFLKCDAMRNIPYTDYTIMFDIKGDLKFPFGKRYTFSATGDVVINPFHIRNTVSDNTDEYTDIGLCLTQKIMDLMIFFKWINRKMEIEEESILEEAIRETYKKCGLTSESKELPKEFCTMEDLYDTLGELMEKSTDEFELQKLKLIRLYIKPYAIGTYSKIFNGQTNWDFDKFVVFDVSNIPENVSKPLYDVLLKDTWQFAKKDGTTNPTRKNIYVDECHEFADENNHQTLKFLSTKLSKQGRGFGVRLVTATQNIPDFLAIPKYGQAIIDNSYFKFFMRMGESDIPVVQKLYRFSDKELKYITGSKDTSNLNTNTNIKLNKAKESKSIKKTVGNKGKGIFMIGSQRVVIQTIASKYEHEIVDPKGFEEVYNKKSRFIDGMTYDI